MDPGGGGWVGTPLRVAAGLETQRGKLRLAMAHCFPIPAETKFQGEFLGMCTHFPNMWIRACPASSLQEEEESESESHWVQVHVPAGAGVWAGDRRSMVTRP